MSLNQSFISDFSEYYRWSQRTKIKYKLHYGWCTGILFSSLAVAISLVFVMHFKDKKRNKWAATWQNRQSDCASSEDSDQPRRPPSLIRVFAVRMKTAWVLSYPLSAQRRLWVFAGRTVTFLVLSHRGSNGKHMLFSKNAKLIDIAE